MSNREVVETVVTHRAAPGLVAVGVLNGERHVLASSDADRPVRRQAREVAEVRTKQRS